MLNIELQEGKDESPTTKPEQVLSYGYNIYIFTISV